MYGQDHPAGDWSQRHQLNLVENGSKTDGTKSRNDRDLEEKSSAEEIRRSTLTLTDFDPVDVAHNKELNVTVATQLCLRSVTWLPALAYLTTFGLELTIDGQMASILFGLFNTHISGFDQTKAGYYTSVL